MEIIGYVAAICIGLILGLLGGGGSILSIPILVYLFSIDAILASAYSLFIVGVTSFIGAIPKYKDHLVNLRTGFLFGIPSIISIFFYTQVDYSFDSRCGLSDRKFYANQTGSRARHFCNPDDPCIILNDPRQTRAAIRLKKD